MEVTGSKDEAIRLRVEERLSIREISERLGHSKSTVSGWLRAYQLTADEVKAKMSANGSALGGWNKKDRGKESRFHALIQRDLTNAEKGRIAEAAVLFRFALHGFHVHSSVFDGHRSDWIVECPKTGRLSRIQVKWASIRGSNHGLPTFSIRCFDGHSHTRTLTKRDCDFIIGYDLFTDDAYVFDVGKLDGKVSVVTISDESRERFDIIA